MKNRYSLILPILMLSACGQNEPAEAPATESEQEVSETESIHTDDDPKETAAFSWKEEGYATEAGINAYIDDPDQKSETNIRNAPNGKVMLKLSQDDSYMVTILHQQDGWFEVSEIVSFMEDNNYVDESMWIHHSVLAADTRNYGNQKIPVYQYPEEKEDYVIHQIEAETHVRISEYYFDFVHINFTTAQGEKVDGWIKTEWICGNPVTTCS